MATVFDSASALLKSYTDAGYTFYAKYEWTGVEVGASTAGSYDLNGGFVVATKADSQPLLLVVTDLSAVDATVTSTNSVMQTYLQFRDWNGQSTDSVPSWMDFVCNLQVPASGAKTATKTGSCGPETLAAKKTGPYTNIKGSTDANSSNCLIQSVLNAELGDGSSYSTTATATVKGTTTSLCVWSRPFTAQGLSNLASGSSVTYMAGFNLWSSL